MRIVRRWAVPALTAGGSLVLFAMGACGGGGDDVHTDTNSPEKGTSAAAVAAAPAAAAAAVASAVADVTGTADAGADAAPPPPPTREFGERDFVESEQSRDPFRSFAGVFLTQSQTRTALQRKVLVDRYALEELKLSGVVLGSPARALLVDPSGLGWIAKVGDFIGRAELVHAGGTTGADVAVNWRVDRIREGDIVLVREDPSHPEIAPTTRILSLRTADEDLAQKSSRNH